MKIKASFRLTTRQYCSGCGTCYMVDMEMEPIAVQEEGLMVHMIKDSLHKISHIECKNCNKKTKHINFYDEKYGMNIS